MSEELDIIRDWQKNMSVQHLAEDVCAVCAQMVSCRDLVDVFPTTEILMVLRNSWLPAACLPRTYDLAKYCGAILCPRGMSRLDDVADIRMCSSCQKPLMAKTVQQPKDAMANFQYFAHAELPQGGSRWFRDREYFGVNACRATVVTHHYQTKSIRGGRVLEEASQRFNRGNVALFLQDPSALSKVLPPSRGDLRGAVCVE